MPQDINPIAAKSGGTRLAYLSWPDTDADTIYLEDFGYSNPPLNVGLASIFLSTTDTGGGTPTITPYLQFKYADGVYGPAHSISDSGGNSSFTSGGEFEARMDDEAWWTVHFDWRIKLVRSSNDSLNIDYAYGCTL